MNQSWIQRLKVSVQSPQLQVHTSVNFGCNTKQPSKRQKHNHSTESQPLVFRHPGRPIDWMHKEQTNETDSQISEAKEQLSLNKDKVSFLQIKPREILPLSKQRHVEEKSESSCD